MIASDGRDVPEPSTGRPTNATVIRITQPLVKCCQYQQSDNERIWRLFKAYLHMLVNNQVRLVCSAKKSKMVSYSDLIVKRGSNSPQINFFLTKGKT